MEEDTSSVLLMSKIGAMIGLGFGSLALGTLPLIVGRYRAKKRLRKPSRPISSDRSSTSTSTSFPAVDSASAADKQVRSRTSSRGRILSRMTSAGFSFRSIQQRLRKSSFSSSSSLSVTRNLEQISRRNREERIRVELAGK